MSKYLPKQNRLPNVDDSCQLFNDFFGMIQTSPVELADLDDLFHKYLELLSLNQDPKEPGLVDLLKTFVQKITAELKQALFELIREIQG